MIYNQLEKIRVNKPKIHCISNIVSANLCANGIIAVGGFPIMAEDIDEVEEITAVCDGLNINLGTLHSKKVYSMILSAKVANGLHIPIVFDPVGVGASTFRMNTMNKIFKNVDIDVVCGNISEIKSIYYEKNYAMGVDANESDLEDSVESMVDLAKKTAMKRNCIVVISGEVDIVTDGGVVYIVQNGHSMLGNITGSGCLLSALITAFVSVNRDNILLATMLAVTTLGVCAEMVVQKGCNGIGSFVANLLDELCNITEDDLRKGAKYEIL